MSKKEIHESLVGRYVKVGVSVGLVALMTACSTASNRFGPFDGTKAKSDPGYNSTRNSSYSDATSGGGDTYSRTVSAKPLDDPSAGGRTYASNTGGSGTYATATNARYSTGGGQVRVNRGDTLYSISRQHGVPVNDLIATNGLQAPYGLQAGQTLTIPSSADGSRVVARAPQPVVRPVAAPVPQTQTPGIHVVRRGETLYGISRSYGHRVEAVASYNQIGQPYTVRIGQRLRIPNASSVVAQQRTVYRDTPKRVTTLSPVPVKPRTVETAPVQRTEPVQKARVQPAPRKVGKPPKMTSSKFRWPVKGRVISKFGTKPNGQRNDGINVAVPEGTSVKAAENGVVAYAGNELKGYGNLVLIRHANNWVTAYAHAKELFVRRGDIVKRGQIIAKAGKSGSVTSPQLHFEVRKGAQAVNPLKYLARNTVAGG